MTTTTAQEAIATLIDLAQQGEIDPWDVQVIDVIDRFLSELGPLDATDSSDRQNNLSRSGQAFLWASMLVLLKADTLEQLEIEEREEIESFESEDIPDDRQSSLPFYLERHIRRRSSAPPPPRRRVTLQELIDQIEQIAAEIEESPPRPRSRLPRSHPQSHRDAVRSITKLAHDENLTEIATRLEQFLRVGIPQLASGQTFIDLDELLHQWVRISAGADRTSSFSERSPSHDRVGVFWALLLLSSQSRVELCQAEFYQDLKIRLIV
jgi:segregation and condensation protein A